MAKQNSQIQKMRDVLKSFLPEEVHDKIEMDYARPGFGRIHVWIDGYHWSFDWTHWRKRVSDRRWTLTTYKRRDPGHAHGWEKLAREDLVHINDVCQEIAIQFEEELMGVV